MRVCALVVAALAQSQAVFRLVCLRVTPDGDAYVTTVHVLSPRRDPLSFMMPGSREPMRLCSGYKRCRVPTFPQSRVLIVPSPSHRSRDHPPRAQPSSPHPARPCLRYVLFVLCCRPISSLATGPRSRDAPPESRLEHLVFFYDVPVVHGLHLCKNKPMPPPRRAQGGSCQCLRLIYYHHPRHSLAPEPPQPIHPGRR